MSMRYQDDATHTFFSATFMAAAHSDGLCYFGDGEAGFGTGDGGCYPGSRFSGGDGHGDGDGNGCGSSWRIPIAEAEYSHGPIDYGGAYQGT